MSLGTPGGDKNGVSVVSLGHTPPTRVTFGGTDMSRGLCLWFGWERPNHDEVTETWVVVHTKPLWS